MASPSLESAPPDDIKDLLTCSMCSRTLSEPRILPCFHNFCKACLGKYVERLRGGDTTIETFPCPTCPSKFTLKSNQDIADLASSHFIKNMVEIMAIQAKVKESATCSRCQDPASSHCATCDKFMCKKCSTESHGFWDGNNDHRVISIEDLDNPEKQVRIRKKLCCLKHKEEVLKYYCETCHELCCIDCVVLDHTKPDHSCLALTALDEKRRATMQSSCTTLDEKLSEGKKALNNICEVMKSLEKNATTAKDQIKEQKENILKIVSEKLDEKAKKMNEEVDQVYGEMHRELSKQHDKIKEYLDKVQASVSLPRNLLKRGSVEEILSSQKLIDEKIEKLRSEKPEDLEAVNDGGIQFIADDIGKINVDEILGKFGHVEGDISRQCNSSSILKGEIAFIKCDISRKCNLENSSSILKGEIAFIKQLQEWLGEKCKWNLCYRASRDGWKGQDFHTHCDNKGPTVVLVKANNCIFGGYTDQHWDTIYPPFTLNRLPTTSPGGTWKRSNSSFLFSLRNKDNLAPFIANIKQGEEQYAIFCYPGYGPWFGRGNDLYIYNNPQANQSSYSNFGHTYQLPPGYVWGSEQAKNLLAGQYKFLTTEIEVFN